MTNINGGDCGYYNCLSIFVVKFFLTLIYIRLPSNVRYFTVTHSNQARVSNKAHCINAINCFSSQGSTNISLNNTFYQRILDHVGTIIHDYWWTKTTDFHRSVKQRQHSCLFKTIFYAPTFEDKGRLHAAMTKSELVTAREISLKHAWVNLPSIETHRDVAIIDLAYLFTGLVTITQSRLVHRKLQGVEHTDPMEWSNSHPSIGEKICYDCSTNIRSF